MQVIVMSDSHGHGENVRKVMDKYPNAEYYLHLGDLCEDPLYYPGLIVVDGNNDYYYGVDDLPDHLIMDIGEHRFYLTHSHRCFGFDRKQQLVSLAKQNECDVVLYGHTHVYNDQEILGVRLLNPGSLYYNRDGSPISYMVLNIDKKHIEVCRKTL